MTADSRRNVTLPDSAVPTMPSTVAAQPVAPTNGSAMSYGEWYERFVRVTNVKSIVREPFATSFTPPESARTALQGDLERILVERHGHLPMMSELSFFKGRVFEAAQLPIPVLDQYINRTAETVYDFLRHVGVEQMPGLTFEVLGLHGDIRAPVDNKVHLYVVSTITDSDIVGMTNVVVGGRIKPISVFGGVSKLGEIQATVDFDFQDGVYTPKIKEQLPIVVALSDQPVKALTSPMAEVLHYLTLDRMWEYMAEDMTAIGPHPRHVGERIVNRWRLLNEGVVHALLQGYLEENQERLGLDPGQVASQREFYSSDATYGRFDAMSSACARVGPRVLLDTFYQDGRALLPEGDK